MEIVAIKIMFEMFQEEQKNCCGKQIVVRGSHGTTNDNQIVVKVFFSILS